MLLMVRAGVSQSLERYSSLNDNLQPPYYRLTNLYCYIATYQAVLHMVTSTGLPTKILGVPYYHRTTISKIDIFSLKAIHYINQLH